MTNSVGIIGGADGPTAIFVTGNPVVPILLIGAAILLVVAGIGFAIGFIVGKRRHK